MNPFFQDGKLYKPMIALAQGVIGDGIVEVPKGTQEYNAIFALIEKNPEFQAEAHWNERPKE